MSKFCRRLCHGLMILALVSPALVSSEAARAADLVVSWVGVDGAAAHAGIKRGDVVIGWQTAEAVSSAVNRSEWETLRLATEDVDSVSLRLQRGSQTRIAELGDGAWQMMVVESGCRAFSWTDAGCWALGLDAELFRRLRESEVSARQMLSASRNLLDADQLAAEVAINRLAPRIDALTGLDAARAHEVMARALRLSDPPKSTEYFLAALRLIESHKPGSGLHGTIGNALARHHLDQRHLGSAVSVLTPLQDQCADQRSVNCGTTDAYLGMAQVLSRKLDSGDQLCAEAAERLSVIRPDSQVLAIAHNCRFIAALFAGRLVAAEAHVEKAIATVQQHHARSTLMVSLRANRALILSWRGEHERAFDDTFMALTEHQRLGASPATIGRDLQNLALITTRQGNFDAARSFLDRAMSLRPERADPILLLIAGLHLRQENSDLAQSALEQIGTEALEHDPILRQRHVDMRGQIAEMKGQLARAEALYRESATLVRDTQPGTSVEAEVLHRLGRVQRELGRFDAAVVNLGGSVAALESQLSRVGGTSVSRAELRESTQITYKSFIDLLVQRGELDQARQVLDRYRASELKRIVDGKGNSPADPRDRREFSAGSAVVAYLVTDAQVHLFFESATTGPVHRVVDIDAEEMAGLITTWREEMINPDASTITETAVAHQLHQLLIEPLPLDGIGRLTVVPDDHLWTLPFAALITGSEDACDGRPCRLADQLIIDHGFEATTVGAATLASNRGTATVFVGPDVQTGVAGTRSIGAAPTPDLEPLPGALAEERAIRLALGRSVLSFVGAHAVESTFYQHAPEAQILHLAGHAFVDPSIALSSYFQMTPEAGQDGRLTAREIMEQLQLDQPLVVLAGCETGAGVPGGGDGLLGLRFALHSAGARDVVASFWRVADESTAELMRLFYQSLALGNDSAAALRDAQIAMMEHADSNMHRPFNWAAFSTSVASL